MKKFKIPKFKEFDFDSFTPSFTASSLGITQKLSRKQVMNLASSPGIRAIPLISEKEIKKFPRNVVVVVGGVTRANIDFLRAGSIEKKIFMSSRMRCWMRPNKGMTTKAERRIPAIMPKQTPVR